MAVISAMQRYGNAQGPQGRCPLCPTPLLHATASAHSFGCCLQRKPAGALTIVRRLSSATMAQNALNEKKGWLLGGGGIGALGGEGWGTPSLPGPWPLAAQAVLRYCHSGHACKWSRVG